VFPYNQCDQPESHNSTKHVVAVKIFSKALIPICVEVCRTVEDVAGTVKAIASRSANFLVIRLDVFRSYASKRHNTPSTHIHASNFYWFKVKTHYT